MIEVKCYFLLLVLVIFYNRSVTGQGFPPMVLSLSPKTTRDSHSSESSESSSSSAEQNYFNDDEIFNKDKRDFLKNSDRFGKSGSPYLTALYAASNPNPINEEKRMARNFLRYGRVPGINYLRFGMGGGPLETALNLQQDSSEELIKRGYAKNHFRFIKPNANSAARFGRSADEQQQEADAELTKNKTSRRKRSIMYEEDGPQSDYWVNNLVKFTKRGYNPRNFLRYGRNPFDLHFLRFGKRMDPILEDNVDNEPQMKRASSLKNFLRWG